MQDFKALLETPEYEFLKTNPHLGKNIILLTLGGSYSYGTNVEGSDVDIRGVAVGSKSDLLGTTGFEQVIDKATDTTVYSLKKLIPLLLNCNPDVIEMLGCKPEHYLQLSEAGKLLLDNRKVFLSRKCVNSFSGYATQQLRRLENAIARDRLPQAKKEAHILQSMERAMIVFAEKYSEFPEGSIRLYTDKSSKADLDEEIFADVTLKHYPAREFGGMVNDLGSVLTSYDKLNHRNQKPEEKLGKHAMHLIRLYMIGYDLLTKGDIITYRGDDLPLLMSIRNGAFQKEDGSFRDEFFDLVSEYETKMLKAIEESSLPKVPDENKVNELVISINEKALGLE